MFVADAPVQLAVLDGLRKAFLPVFQRFLLAGLVQQTVVQFLVEIPFAQHLLVEQAENQPVHQYRLEDFRNIQRQRIAPITGFVQVADGGVQLRMIDLIQTECVTHHVAKRNQCVDFIGRRLFRAIAHLESGNNFAESIVIYLTDISLPAHQLINAGCISPLFIKLRDLIDIGSQLPAAALIIFQIAQDVGRRAFHKLMGYFHPAFGGRIGLGLLDDHLSAQQVIFGHEASRVMFVIIEKVNRDSVFAQEIVECAVRIERTETVKIVYADNGQVFCRSFSAIGINGDKFQGVILSAHPPGIE